jgi:hypothetical protein
MFTLYHRAQSYELNPEIQVAHGGIAAGIPATVASCAGCPFNRSRIGMGAWHSMIPLEHRG